MTGVTVAVATQRITDAGLRVAADFGTDEDTLDPDLDDLVASTTPVEGSLVDPNFVVTLNLYNYHGVSVPSLVGLSPTAAGIALTALNLTLGSAGTEIDVVNQLHNDVIRAQNPAANTVVAPQTAIDYQVGRLVAPDLDGLTQAQAEAAVTLAGLVGTATDVTAGATTANNDTVVTDSQSPAAGTAVQPGAGISYQLYNYVAPGQTAVPDLTGLSRTQAEAAIVAAGLVASASSTITEVAAEADQVLTQNPAAGTSVNPGSTVAFTYGSLRIRLPDWVGETRTTAVAAVTDLGLTPIIATGSQTSDVANQNVVESMTPDADSLVLPASQVILTIWNYVP